MTHLRHAPALLLCLLAVGGCGGSNGPARSKKASAGMTEARTEVNKSTVQLDATMASLAAMTAEPGKNLRAKYADFSSNLAETREIAAETGAKADRMRTDGDDYFAEWENEAADIANEDIRTMSTDRRIELKARFHEISTSFAAVKAAYAPVISDLTDIERSLGNDLTPAAITAITPIADKARRNADDLRVETTALSSRIDNLVATLSPGERR
ncbi:MAG TPA: DUF2959 family protein [Planctomycetota bacterium]|nr:DUF2959 family protein [Planctomycetota bacterium]